MIPILDQLIPWSVVVAGNSTVTPAVINFTDTTNSLYTALAGIIGLIGVILASPGFKSWISHTFGIRKEQIEADATLLGTLAAQMLKSKEQIAWVIQLMYNVAPDDVRKDLDIKVAPILADIQNSIDQINNVLNNIVPKAHPNTVTMINRNTSSLASVTNPMRNTFSLDIEHTVKK